MVEWKMSLPPPPHPHPRCKRYTRELKQRRRRWQRERHKAIGLDWLNSRGNPGEYSSKSLKHSIVKGI